MTECKHEDMYNGDCQDCDKHYTTIIDEQRERIEQLEAEKHNGPCPDCPYLDEIPPAPGKIIDDLQQRIAELEADRKQCRAALQVANFYCVKVD